MCFHALLPTMVDILRSGWELLFNVLIYNWFGALCERGRGFSSVLCMCVV